MDNDDQQQPPPPEWLRDMRISKSPHFNATLRCICDIPSLPLGCLQHRSSHLLQSRIWHMYMYSNADACRCVYWEFEFDSSQRVRGLCLPAVVALSSRWRWRDHLSLAGDRIRRECILHGGECGMDLAEVRLSLSLSRTHAHFSDATWEDKYVLHRCFMEFDICVTSFFLSFLQVDEAKERRYGRNVN